MYRLIILAVLLLISKGALATIDQEKLEPKHFIAISDIHFNPLDGCESLQVPCPILNELMDTEYQVWDKIFEKYSTKNAITYYHNTNYALLVSSLKELQRIAIDYHPQFMLVLGDFLEHHLQSKFRKFSGNKSQTAYKNFVKKTLQFLTYKLNQTLPNVSIYPVLGNVDSYGRDYHVIPGGDFLRDISAIWITFLKNQNNEVSFLQTFKKAGYYSAMLSSHEKLIILDTVLFSPRSQQAAVKQAAQEELIWLKNELNIAKLQHQSVLIVFHIPPGIDIYLSSALPYKIIKNFWLPKYTKAFLEIIKNFPDTVAGVLSGHIHVDLFQFTIEGHGNILIPMIITPSLSPIFGNNPAIKVFNYEGDSLRLINFERYYKPLSDISSDWRRSNRLDSIQQSDCRYCYFTSVIRYLVINNFLLDFLTKYYAGSKDVESDDNDWFSYYWCSMYTDDMQTYKHCINES